MTSFVLKIIAMSSMFMDHLGDSMLRKYSWLNLIGRIAFPIFAFQISEGYQKTKNLKKYFFRLFLFAIISQIPYKLVQDLYLADSHSLNVFFTLFFGLLSIYFFDHFEKTNTNKFVKYSIGLLFVIFISIIAELLCFDYGAFGIIIIFLFYFFRNNKVLSTLSFCIACILKYTIAIIEFFDYRYIILCLFTILPIFFINSYNGKQGPKIKYLLYLFYPVHLLVLYFLFR